MQNTSANMSFSSSTLDASTSQDINSKKKKTLEDYEILPDRPDLGKGAYATVKLVREKEDPTKIYAMKIISKKELLTYSTPEALKREIKTHRKTVHPHIVKLITYFEDKENVYLVMEYAEGGNLFFYIRKKQRIQEKEAFVYFFQTALCIDYLHKKSIMHRDLKPENLLLDAQGNIKICDFGSCAETIENRNTFCGTVEYIPPEMIQKKPHDYKADIWSLGILLYEMLHGYPPFRGKSNEEKFSKILGGDIEFASDVSPEAQDLIKAILKLDPKDRLEFEDIFVHPWLKKFEKELKMDLKKFIYHAKTRKPKELNKSSSFILNTTAMLEEFNPQAQNHDQSGYSIVEQANLETNPFKKKTSEVVTVTDSEQNNKGANILMIPDDQKEIDTGARKSRKEIFDKSPSKVTTDELMTKSPTSSSSNRGTENTSDKEKSKPSTPKNLSIDERQNQFSEQIDNRKVLTPTHNKSGSEIVVPSPTHQKKSEDDFKEVRGKTDGTNGRSSFIELKDSDKENFLGTSKVISEPGRDQSPDHLSKSREEDPFNLSRVTKILQSHQENPDVNSIMSKIFGDKSPERPVSPRPNGKEKRINTDASPLKEDEGRHTNLDKHLRSLGIDDTEENLLLDKLSNFYDTGKLITPRGNRENKEDPLIFKERPSKSLDNTINREQILAEIEADEKKLFPKLSFGADDNMFVSEVTHKPTNNLKLQMKESNDSRLSDIQRKRTEGEQDSLITDMIGQLGDKRNGPTQKSIFHKPGGYETPEKRDSNNDQVDTIRNFSFGKRKNGDPLPEEERPPKDRAAKEQFKIYQLLKGNTNNGAQNKNIARRRGEERPPLPRRSRSAVSFDIQEYPKAQANQKVYEENRDQVFKHYKNKLKDIANFSPGSEEERENGIHKHKAPANKKAHQLKNTSSNSSQKTLEIDPDASIDFHDNPHYRKESGKAQEIKKNKIDKLIKPIDIDDEEERVARVSTRNKVDLGVFVDKFPKEEEPSGFFGKLLSYFTCVGRDNKPLNPKKN